MRSSGRSKRGELAADAVRHLRGVLRGEAAGVRHPTRRSRRVSRAPHDDAVLTSSTPATRLRARSGIGRTSIAASQVKATLPARPARSAVRPLPPLRERSRGERFIAISISSAASRAPRRSRRGPKPCRRRRNGRVPPPGPEGAVARPERGVVARRKKGGRNPIGCRRRGPPRGRRVSTATTPGASRADRAVERRIRAGNAAERG